MYLELVHMVLESMVCWSATRHTMKEKGGNSFRYRRCVRLVKKKKSESPFIAVSCSFCRPTL